MPKITPCLWFDTQAEDAAALYTSLFKNSQITNVVRNGEAGPRDAEMVMMVTFELDGQEFVALNGGPQFSFNESISLQIPCEDQAEVDHYWDGLIANGGEESQCGWLKDPFGVSWQVFPTRLPELISDPDPARAQRAMRAMLEMKRIDIAAVEAAAAGDS